MTTPSREALRRQILALVREYHDAAPAADFRPGATPVHYAGRVYDGAELVNLVDASLEFWLTAGRHTAAFESRLAGYLGVAHAKLANSGSSANLLAVSALTSPTLRDRRLRPGDEVITAAAAFPTTVNPIIQNGGVPVFVDVEIGTYVPRVEWIEAAVTNRTRAVVLAHTMGVPFEVSEVRELCDRRGLWLVEDCCDALGSRYRDRPVGTFGDLATFSFYPAHHITLGEGGAVVTGDDDLARLVASFRDWGRDCFCNGGRNNSCGRRFAQQYGRLPHGYDHKYVYSHVGYNLKATDLQAAIGVAQLDKLESFVDARKRHHARLAAGLERHEDRLVLHRAPAHADPSWFGYVATVRPDAGMTRAQLVEGLEAARVETRPLFCGNLLLHPAYQGVEHRVSGGLANSDVITGNTFFVGVYPGLTDRMLDHVVGTFDSLMRR